MTFCSSPCSDSGSYKEPGSYKECGTPPSFAPPMSYLTRCATLSPELCSDLELLDSRTEEQPSVYDHLFGDSSRQSRPMDELRRYIATHYTTDASFLRETQRLVRACAPLKPVSWQVTYNDYMNLCVIPQEQGRFLSNNMYFTNSVPFELDKPLNTNGSVMLCTQLYHLASPWMALLFSLIVLLLPLVLMCCDKAPFTLANYMHFLQTTATKHPLFHVLVNHSSLSQSQLLISSVYMAFYVYGVFQNIQTSQQILSNWANINAFFAQLQTHLSDSLHHMKWFEDRRFRHVAYQAFGDHLSTRKERLLRVLRDVQTCTEHANSYAYLGFIMATFYNVATHHNEDLMYLFGFNAYTEMLLQTHQHWANKQLGAATYVVAKNKGVTKPKFRNMSHPAYVSWSPKRSGNTQRPVKNHVDLRRHWVLTGPNASGKTTMLKAVLTNLLLSQQLGFGCFDSLRFTPIQHFFCHINIPDTLGRDSLFQAEARRCQHILQWVEKHKNQTHFCVFDELFSGTNPSEAVASSSAFMEYLVRQPHVTCMLTTHFLEVCDQLNASSADYVVQRHMGKRYRVQRGVSRVQGGLDVLAKLNFPIEVLTTARLFSCLKTAPTTTRC